jgi:hypothetical protein
MTLFPMSQQVEEALHNLDWNDPKLRKYTGRVFEPYKHWSYNDMFILGIINRSMSLLFGFTALVRSCNYYSAHHLVRLHLDSFLRFSVIWLVDNAQPITKQIFEGKQLNQIEYALKKCYTDKYLSTQLSKDYPWVKNTYRDTSAFIHLSSSHVFNATEIMDKEKRSVGLHASKYDMKVTDKDRLEGTAVMQLITDGVYDLLEKWCVYKEKKLEKEGETAVGDEWHPFTFLAMKDFIYHYQGTTYMAAVTPYTNQEGYFRYRVMFDKSKGVIIGHAGVRGLNNQLLWVQELRNGIIEEPHELIQAVGEGLESAGMAKQ